MTLSGDEYKVLLACAQYTAMRSHDEAQIDKANFRLDLFEMKMTMHKAALAMVEKLTREAPRGLLEVSLSN